MSNDGTMAPEAVEDLFAGEHGNTAEETRRILNNAIDATDHLGFVYKRGEDHRGDIFVRIANNQHADIAIFNRLIDILAPYPANHGTLFWVNRHVANRAIEHGGYTAERFAWIAKNLAMYSSYDRKRVINALAKADNEIDEEVQKAIASYGHSDFAMALLKSEHVTEGTIAALAKTESRTSLVLAFARHAKTSEELLTTFSTHVDAKVRKTVANNANTPEARLRKLIQDPDQGVASSALRMAKRRKIDLDVSNEDELSEDSEVYSFFFSGSDDNVTRRDIAANPATASSTLRDMLSDKEWNVVVAAATNPSLSPDDMMLALQERHMENSKWQTGEWRNLATLFLQNQSSNEVVLEYVTSQAGSLNQEACLAYILHPLSKEESRAYLVNRIWSANLIRKVVRSGRTPAAMAGRWAGDYRVTIVRVVAPLAEQYPGEVIVGLMHTADEKALAIAAEATPVGVLAALASIGRSDISSWAAGALESRDGQVAA